MELQSQTVTIDNLKINYTLSGSLSAPFKVLILHGWNQAGIQSWLEFLKLNTNSDILFIALDLPCFGLSDCPDKVWDTGNYANFCIKFIQFLQQKYNFKNPKWNLSGHSFGGGIATLVSTQVPEIVDKLILVAPAIIRKKLNLKQVIIQSITKIFGSLVELPILNLFKPLLSKIWYKIIASPDYNLTSGIKRKIMQTILKQDLTSKLNLVQAKSFLIWGTKDSYTPFTDFNIVLKLLKPKKSLVYEDYSHGIHIKNPTKLYQDISDFVTQTDINH